MIPICLSARLSIMENIIILLRLHREEQCRRLSLGGASAVAGSHWELMPGEKS